MVQIKTRKGVFRSKKAVFALGTWINKLIPGLPVQSRVRTTEKCFKKENETLERVDKCCVLEIEE